MPAHGLPIQSPCGLDHPMGLKVSHGHAKPADHGCRRDYGKQSNHGGNLTQSRAMTLGKAPVGPLASAFAARVVEWQTRRIQNPLPSRACGFKSRSGHKFRLQ